MKKHSNGFELESVKGIVGLLWGSVGMLLDKLYPAADVGDQVIVATRGRFCILAVRSVRGWYPMPHWVNPERKNA